MLKLARTVAGLLALAIVIASVGSLLPSQAQQARAIDYVNATSGNVANATATATLTATGNRQQFITGFEITYSGATAGQCVVATVTGLIGGTENYTVCSPTGVTVGGVPLIIQQTTPLPSNYNTAIVVTLPALGAGNANAAVNVHGYILQQ